jgi:isopentenyl-diphosphate delta-isomerase type 1
LVQSLAGTPSEMYGGEQLVVLLDEDGNPCGSATKAEVHHENTPLHLAFSCWLVAEGRDDLRVLLTQRAASKRTWPLAWTNSFCGHPSPDEDMEPAIRRRAADELGASVSGLRLVLPDFRYTARMPNGVTENEVCPVYVACLDGELAPDPDEVERYRWVDWHELLREVASTPQLFSPWLLSQLPLLRGLRDGGTSLLPATSDDDA